jgi:hypothetical protein
MQVLKYTEHLAHFPRSKILQSLHAMALQLWVDLVEDLRLLHGHVRVGGGEVYSHQPVTDALLYIKRRPAKRQISYLIFFNFILHIHSLQYDSDYYKHSGLYCCALVI